MRVSGVEMVVDAGNQRLHLERDAPGQLLVWDARTCNRLSILFFKLDVHLRYRYWCMPRGQTPNRPHLLDASGTRFGDKQSAKNKEKKAHAVGEGGGEVWCKSMESAGDGMCGPEIKVSVSQITGRVLLHGSLSVAFRDLKNSFLVKCSFIGP